jgi:hypothetical protein
MRPVARTNHAFFRLTHVGRTRVWLVRTLCLVSFRRADHCLIFHLTLVMWTLTLVMWLIRSPYYPPPSSRSLDELRVGKLLRSDKSSFPFRLSLYVMLEVNWTLTTDTVMWRTRVPLRHFVSFLHVVLDSQRALLCTKCSRAIYSARAGQPHALFCIECSRPVFFT